MHELDAFKTIVAPEKQLDHRSLKDLQPRQRGELRDAGGAVQEADDLLAGPVTGRSENGAVVTRDPQNVNSPEDTNPRSARHQAAKEQVEANRRLEEERLAQMSPEDRASYEAVRARCREANDPVAELALQKLLLEGKLPGANDLKGEGNLLSHLARLSDPNTPLADGVDRDQLVTDLVQELATPTSINQGPRGTCAPTSIAVQLAMENPAEYARIAAGLASPSGEVRLAGGETLRREDGTAADDGSGRSTVQRMMGPAMMEMGNGDQNYDSATDAGAGAWSPELDHLYEQIMGRPMSEQRTTTDEQRADAMATIDAEVAQGQTVPVALAWPGGYHKVLVTGTETVDGVEYVKYVNPWGREERMPRDEFERRIADVSWDPTTPRAASQAAALQRSADLSRWLSSVAA
ncbi:MAG: hypothetical protein JNK82_19610 [Myxococcaceae bacterium]|nr:hypothetical protein [Myxococcaceae bacterium]